MPRPNAQHQVQHVHVPDIETHTYVHVYGTLVAEKEQKDTQTHSTHKEH